MKRTFKNEGGNIEVRYCPKTQFGACGIVEMLHLFDNNKSGCVIGYWKVRDVDGQSFPEFGVVHDRLTEIDYSFDIMEAIRYGQKLAEISILSNEEN
jgi:hypothetical protein